MGAFGLFVRQTINGIGIAGILVFAAVGLSLIFGMTRIVNFAHGVLFALGGLLTSVLIRRLPDFPGHVWIFAFVVSPILVVLVGLGIQAIVETTRDRPEEIFIMHSLLITFSISLILIELFEIVFGVNVRLVPAPAGLQQSITLGGIQMSRFSVFIIALTFVAVGVLWYLIYRTRYGMAVRASLFNPEMTSALGNDVTLLRRSVFAMGSYLAGLGGSLWAISLVITPATSHQIILNAFLVTVIGGLGSFWGILAGAAILGLMRAYVTGLGYSQWLLVIPFVLVMIILYVRPQGLFGRARE